MRGDFAPAPCPICGSIGARALMLDHIEAEHGDMYDIARAVTDQVMGEGTYATANEGNPDPGVQAAIRRWRVSDQLAFRCAHRGGTCACVGACDLDRALAQTPPPCARCGRQTRLEDRFRVDHEQADGPGVTMQLVELGRDLEEAGVKAWGAEVLVYYCEPCDFAEAHFIHPEAT